MAAKWIFDQDGDRGRDSCTTSTSWQRRKQGCRGRGRDLCNYSRSQGVLGPSAMRSRPVKWLDKGGLLHSTVQQVGMIEEVWGEGLQTPSCLVFALWCRWQEFGPSKIADSDQPQCLRKTRTRATGNVARASPVRLGLKPLKANEG